MTIFAHDAAVRVSSFESCEADAWETHQAMMRLEVLLDAKQCDYCAADLSHGETGLCEDCSRDGRERQTFKVVEPRTEKNAVIEEAADREAADRLDW